MISPSAVRPAGDGVPLIENNVTDILEYLDLRAGDQPFQPLGTAGSIQQNVLGSTDVEQRKVDVLEKIIGE